MWSNVHRITFYLETCINYECYQKGHNKYIYLHIIYIFYHSLYFPSVHLYLDCIWYPLKFAILITGEIGYLNVKNIFQNETESIFVQLFIASIFYPWKILLFIWKNSHVTIYLHQVKRDIINLFLAQEVHGLRCYEYIF